MKKIIFEKAFLDVDLDTFIDDLCDDYETVDHFSIIKDKINWFLNIFKDEITKEGWCIIKFVNYGYQIEEYKFMVNRLLSNTELLSEITSKPKQDEVYQLAKDYGWEIDDNGVIHGYDINNCKRNRHLLTGNDLGLL